MKLPIIVICTILSQSNQPALSTLESSLNVWDVAVTDMDQNSIQDVLLLASDETAFPRIKQVKLFLADDAGIYPKLPGHRLNLAQETGAVMLAEVDGSPPMEIVELHAEGAIVHRFTGDSFAEIGRVAFHSLFPSNSKEPLFVKHGAKDLTGNGIDEWLIPTPTGLAVRNMDGLIAMVPCDVVSEMRSSDSMHIVHRLPDYQSFSLEGQQQLGLAFLSDEFADFAYGEGWQQYFRYRIPTNLEEKWDASAKMADITANGFPDLIVTQTRGTVRLQSETHVYVATTPFAYPKEPTAVFSASGAISSPVVLDVNGNGMLDLVFIRIPFGVKNIVNFFMRGKISVRAEVYLFNGATYSQSPDYSTNLLMDAPEGRERVAYTFGDFDGDGRVDVAYGRANDTFVVHVGTDQKFISSRPWASLNLPSFGTARPYDLNRKGGEDIILFRPGGRNAKRVDVIVF